MFNASVKEMLENKSTYLVIKVIEKHLQNGIKITHRLKPNNIHLGV